MDLCPDRAISLARRRVQRLIVVFALVPLLGTVLACGTLLSVARTGAFTGYQQFVLGPLWMWVGEPIHTNQPPPPVIGYQNTGNQIAVTLALPSEHQGHYWTAALIVRRYL